MGWIQERQLCILFIKHAYKGKNPKQQSNWGKQQPKKKKKKKKPQGEKQSSALVDLRMDQG